MSIQNSALVRDNSTLTNFKQWAQAISSFFATAGWLQSSDTGQVNWSTISTVPSAGTYVYEIWQPNDGLTNFYLKMEYGTNAASSNTGPSFRVSVGASTNGAGTLTGFNFTTGAIPDSAVTVTSTSTQWQCYFSGAPGRMGMMMWRDETSATAQAFWCIQRSKNSSGSDTGSYVTVVAMGNGPSNNDNFQQSLSFASGPSNAATFGASGTLCCIRNATLTSDAFAGGIPFSPIFPSVGFFDNPMDAVGIGAENDFTEGAQYSIASSNMPYGVSHNYLASKNGVFARAGIGFATNNCLLMRYD